MDYRLATICGAVAAALGMVAASPAAATRTISYSGTVVVQPHSTVGYDFPGLLNGTYDFRATFRYDDALEMTSASLSVDGVTRSNFVCPLGFGNCAALFAGATGIGSSVGTTPEEYISMAVGAPSGFGGVDLLAPGYQSYVPQLGDDALAYVSWEIFYSPVLGYAYNDGYGEIALVESAVPEPAGWALMIAGFGMVGSAARRSRQIAA